MATAKTTTKAASPAASDGAGTGKVPLPAINGYPVMLDTATGHFEAKIGTETVSKTTLQLLTKHIENMSRGVRAIVAGRKLRDVKIIGLDGENFKLSSGGKVSQQSNVFPWDDALWKKLNGIDAKRLKAEETFNAAIEACDDETAQALQGVANIDASQFEQIKKKGGDESAEAEAAANDGDADPDDEGEGDEEPDDEDESGVAPVAD